MSAPGQNFDDGARSDARARAPSAVYFDNNATTPLDDRVRDAMVEWLGSGFGNPSSIHRVGQRARGVLEESRRRVAALIGADPLEVVFTASGTEANNTILATVGRRARAGEAGRHLVLSAIEHPSIVQGARRLAEEEGFEITEVRPSADGVVRPEEVAAVLREETALVALMLAHNELGTLQPVAEVARVARERGVPVLCDAVQAAGKVPVDVGILGVDWLTIAAHKFHGPLGAAALWVRPGAPIEPLLVGGGQERRRRASTENLPALLGFGVACETAERELSDRARHLSSLRDRFENGLRSMEDVVVRCAEAARLPNTSCVTFGGIDATTLLMRLDLEGFAVSTGAACASGAVEPSRNLLALGLEERDALSTLRVSFGVSNTRDEVDALLAVLPRNVEALRRGAGAVGGSVR